MANFYQVLVSRFATLVYFLLPTFVVLYFVRVVRRVRGLGWRVEAAFDPNNIRKVIPFKRSADISVVKMLDVELVLDLSDHVGYRSFVRQQPFEMSIFNYLKTHRIPQKGQIFDIGANIGMASIPACKRFGCELLAVEASSHNASMLLSSVYRNGLRANVIVGALCEAVEDQFVRLNINPGNAGANSLKQGWNQGALGEESGYVYSKCWTLDQLVEMGCIDFSRLAVTKIDVEGMEESVLRGGRLFLERNSSPILLEYRLDGHLQYLNETLDGLVGLLRSHGYEIFSIDGEDFRGYFDHACSYENIIAVKNKMI